MITYKPYSRRDVGQVREINDLPLSSVFNAAVGYGREFLQAQNAVQRMVEMGVASGNVLSPDEANERYSMPGLEFNEPVLEGQAQLMRRRKELENARMFYLQNAKGFTGMSAAFAGQVIGSQMSFTDFGLNFVPIVGQAKYRRMAGIASRTKRGAKTIRMGGGLGRPVVRVKNSPLIAQRDRLSLEEGRSVIARVVGGAVDASVGSLIAEIPIYIANRQQQAEYGFNDILIGVAGSAIVGGGLRGAGIVFERLTAPTKREMAAVAHDQFLNDVDVDVAGIAKLDRGVIAGEILADEARRMRDMAEIRRLAKKAVDDQEAEIYAAVGGEGRWYNDILRSEAYEARLGAKDAVEARKAKIAAKVRARVEAIGVLGRVTREQAIQIGESAAKRGGKGQQAKTLKALLERAKGGDVSAADNIARMFFLELDETSRNIPSLFKTGEVSPKFTPAQLKAIDEIVDLLPDRTKKMMQRISADRLDFDSRIEAGIQAKADRIERAEYKRRIADLKRQDAGKKSRFKKRVEKERLKRYKAEVRRLQTEYDARTQQLIEDTYQNRLRELIDERGLSKSEPGQEPIPRESDAGEGGMDTTFHQQDATEIEATIKRDGELTASEQAYLDNSFDYEPKAIEEGLLCMRKG